MKNILIVDFIATTPIYTSYFCNALHEHGLKTDLLSPVNESELELLNHLSLPFVRHQQAASKNIRKTFQYISNWLYLLRNAKKYTAIHFQWFPMLSRNRMDLYFLNLLVKRNPNLFFTVHNILPHGNKSEQVKRNYKHLYEIIPHLTVHTSKTSRDLKSIFNINPDKIIEITHGPLFKEFAKTPNKNSGTTTLSMIGNVKPYKGFEDAFQLVESVKDTELEFYLIIAGIVKEEYLINLKKTVAELGIDDLITFIPRYLSTREVLKLHQETDAILAPYQKIDQSGAVITALSLGRPVIGYSVGGLNDLITNKFNGFLSTTKKIPELKEGLKWLKETDQQHIFDNCLKSTESFSWKKTANILASKY